MADDLERDKAYRQAARLFTALAPQCIPLENLAGVIDQIDNWTMGAKAQLAASEAARRRLREALISAKAALKGREHTGFIDDALAEPGKE